MARKAHGTSADSLAGAQGVKGRRAIAMGEEGEGDFGVEHFAEAQRHGGHHPDHIAGTGAKEELEDHERGIGHPIHHTRNHHPAQAAPNHGPHHPDGYMFGHQHEDHPEHRHETETHKERLAGTKPGY